MSLRIPPLRLLLLFTLGLVLPAAGCRKASETVHIALGTPLINLEPCSEDHETNLILGNIYESLVEYDKDFGLRPLLALSWETPNDNRWIFRLRQGVRFHNGDPLTAADVVHSLRRARDHPDSLLQSYFAPVETVTAENDFTVAIVTRTPIGDLPHYLTAAGIIPAGQEPDGTGTGPYRLVEHNEEGAVLAAFEGYWGGRPEIEELRFFLTRPDDPVERILEGRPRLILRDAVRFAALSKRGFSVVQKPGLSVAYLGFNTAVPPFDDPRVRQAVALAVRTDRIVSERLQGHARPICQVVPFLAFGHHPGLSCAPDPEKARKALLASGRPLPLPVSLLTAPKAESTVRLVAEDLNAVGFKVAIEVRPWPEVVERMLDGRTAFYFSGYMSSFGNALPTLETLFASWGSSNTFRYVNPTMDDLLRRAAAISDDVARLPLLHAAAEEAARDLPLVPLYNPLETYVFIPPTLKWEPRADGRILGKELRMD